MAGGSVSRAIGVVVICGVLLVSGLMLNMQVQSTAELKDYNKGYEIGLEAYTYGLPLLVTEVTFQTMTSINISVGAYGPVNQFNNVRTLNDPQQHGGRGAGREQPIFDRLAGPEQGAPGASCARMWWTTSSFSPSSTRTRTMSSTSAASPIPFRATMPSSVQAMAP